MERMNDPNPTRQTLLERIRRQDESSWKEFVHYYRHYIYIICRRMGLNHHDGEEVVQQVLVKIWEKIATFDYDSRKRFRGWLCTVTGNAVKDFVRKRKVREIPEDLPINRLSQPEIEEIAEQEWRSYVTTLALKKVKEQFSEEVIDIFMELHAGTPRPQVAEKFNLPPNTISVYKKRVFTALCREIRYLEDELS